jgi:peptide/nickel transport system substrate-binding protein
MARRRCWTVLILGLVGAVACTPAAAPAPAATPAATPLADVVLMAADSGLPPSASPESVAAKMHIFAAQFDALIEFGEKFALRPAVAERWELLPDGSGWRFFLRRDMSFSNGARLTASDVEFTVNLFLTTRTPQQPMMPNLTQAKRVDDYTVDLLTRQRDYSILYVAPHLYVFPQAYYQQVGRDTFATRPIGSGPYELVEYRPADLMVYRRRPEPHPYRSGVAREIRWRAVPETTVALAGLRTGEIDIAVGAFSGDQADQARREGLTVDVQLTTVQALRFDRNAIERTGSPLKDIRVRQALNYAVDRDALARTLYRGYAQPIGQIAPPGSLLHDEALKPYPYDPAKAKQLLAEAGYPNGFKVQGPIDYTRAFFQPALLQAVQSYFRDIGVQVEIEEHEFGVWVDIFLTRGVRPRNEMIASNQSDANGFFSLQRGLMTCQQPPQNVIWCAPGFDENYSAAQTELDPARRAAFLRAANKAYVDEVAMVFLLVVPTITLASPKVQGLTLTTPFFWNLDRVSKRA